MKTPRKGAQAACPIVFSAESLNRFMSKVRKTTTCWMWEGSLRGHGYGQFYLNGSMAAAHRISYQHFVGPIPIGLVLDHICRVRTCVNPEHLRTITNKENVLIGIGNSAVNKRKTHCKNGHAFDDKNTYFSGNLTWRRCKACDSANFIRRNNRRRAKKLSHVTRILPPEEIGNAKV